MKGETPAATSGSECKERASVAIFLHYAIVIIASLCAAVYKFDTGIPAYFSSMALSTSRSYYWG